MKTLGCQTTISQVGLANRLKGMEKRCPGLEDLKKWIAHSQKMLN